MNIKVIVFDFDGTIADTRDAIVEITNRLSGEFGYKPVTPKEVSQLRDLNSKEIIRRSEIPLTKLPFLLRRLKLELGQKVYRLQPVYGVASALAELKGQGYQVGIVTSNSEENVVTFLENNQLSELFEFIYSGSTLFGKNQVINNFIKKNNFASEAVVYVGDETRDIEAARKSKIKVVAVSWGFNSRDALAQYRPDFLIDEPQNLVEAIALLASSPQAVPKKEKNRLIKTLSSYVRNRVTFWRS